MTDLKLFMAPLLIFFSASCSQAPDQEMPPERTAAIEDTLRQFALAMEEGILTKDLDGMFDRFTDSPEFTFGEDGQLFPPKAEMLEMFRPIYAAWKGEVFFQWDTIRVAVLGPGSGVISAMSTNWFDQPDGSRREGTTFATYALRRNGDRWELVHGHGSHWWNEGG